MKTKILSGLICCLGIFSANAQTITAPTGQSLVITNPVNITGGGVNISTDSSFKIGGVKLLSNKGINNLFLGANAGSLNTAPNNLFLGSRAGLNNTSGPGNLFMGYDSGNSNTTGQYNTFIGLSAGSNSTTGGYNLFIGGGAGFSNSGGQNNVFLGTNSGQNNGNGNENIFIGYSSGVSTANVNGNSLLGTYSGYSNVSGANNSGIGSRSGYSNTSGSQNVFIGDASGYALTSGNSNTFIGSNSDVGGALSAGLTNSTAIGANSRVTASNSIVLGSNANVGIGTNAPTAKLEISSSTGSGLKFTNLTSASATSSGGSNKVLSVDATGNVILVGIVGATTTSVGGPVAENWKESDGYLYNNSTNGVVIKGTGLDGNSLIVKGGVLSKEVNVKVEGSESWPDYVFKPNYKRMTLGEVEKFIAINGHLPNIPSATEMAITGNNLGKTDAKLLEKVEELTLYLLEMKKANDAQATELKALKQQVSKLKKK